MQSEKRSMNSYSNLTFRSWKEGKDSGKGTRRKSDQDRRKPGSEDGWFKILGHSYMQTRDPKQRGMWGREKVPA